mgnify:FL=1
MPHVKSYYAATANQELSYEKLNSNIRTQVCVIGAGFTGLNTAINLAKKDFDVVLIESEKIGWGASGRNGGQLISGFSFSDHFEKKGTEKDIQNIWQLGAKSADLVRERVSEFSIDCDLKEGFIDVATNGKHMDELIDRSEEWKQSDYHHNLELVDENQVKKYVNSDSYVGGLIDSGSGHIHPLNLCLGEAKAASELGVMIYEDTHAVKISGGSPSKVVTENGIIESDYIVIATNAYIGDLNKKLRRMVMPAASCIIATEPLSSELAEKVIPSDMAVCDQNTILDYYRLSADKRMLFGGRFNYSGKIPSDDKIKIEIKKRMVSVFPQLSEARVDYAWSGNVAVSLKKIPQLGRIDNNIFYSQGYSGHGVAPTHMAAKVIADAIEGDDEVLNTLSSVNHIQLPGGKWFSSPATAIGMMYYQLKDKIANFSR